jgi:hypothetical protein
MPLFVSSWKEASLALAALVCTFGIRSDIQLRPQGRLASLPRVTLWVWERREDLRSVNPRRFAVAYLDQTLTIGLAVESQRRRNPVVFPATAVRIPVVRIEAPPNAVLNAENRTATIQAILLSAREPGIGALQIDFDATRSQRAFYRELLIELRRQMELSLPLSVTALASWCSHDDWLPGLPIDEAVPMLFRMEPDRRRAPPNLDDFQIREPLCQSSVGISTTEPWPDNMAGKRIYVFADNGWQKDSPIAVDRRLP